MIAKVLTEFKLLQNVCKNFGAKLIYTEHGEPIKVIRKVEECISEPDKNQILVKILAAPINPVDINIIQGKYPIKASLPAVPGYEGVGIVQKVGSNVASVNKGDYVVPLADNLGTWRSHILMKSNDVLKVPETMGLIEAATLAINPCTAYRMLKDFIHLKPNDLVIQNGANSACGQNIIQMCKYWGIRTLNIIRDRPDVKEVINYLKQLGATYVLTEEELNEDFLKHSHYKGAKLGLNCIGGKSSLLLALCLDENSTLVTYGGMSKEPVLIPRSLLVFKNIEARGFWIAKWNDVNKNSKERNDMFNAILNMVKEKKLHGPVCEFVHFNDFAKAIKKTMSPKGMVGKKLILDFTQC